jgi:hypothetical protein
MQLLETFVATDRDVAGVAYKDKLFTLLMLLSRIRIRLDWSP